jgi:hypothetical protein
MNKLLAILVSTTLIGCAHNSAPPLDVSQIPNDCANRDAIVRWLNEQATLPRQPLESEKDYERHRASIRHHVWRLRYHCRSV